MWNILINNGNSTKCPQKKEIKNDKIILMDFDMSSKLNSPRLSQKEII